MKKTTPIIAMCFALLTVTQVNAQLQSKFKLSNLQLPSGSKLTWYKQALLPATATSSGTSVLHSLASNGNRVDVGVGLPDAQESFSNNGAARQVASGNQVCTVQPMKVDFLSVGDFNLFSADNSFMPGQFFNINSVIGNSFSSFNSPQRKAYQLGINIFNENNNNPNMLNVTNLSRSPLPEVQSTLLAPNFGAAIPAQGVVSVVKINSEFELKANLSTSQGIFLPLEEFGIPADITAGIKQQVGGSTSLQLKYYLLNLFQPLYTINVLTNHNELFTDPNAYATCANGAYVESVTYGRRVIIIIGSAESASKINASLNAALSASFTGGELAGVQLGSRATGETNASLKVTAAKFYAKIYGGEGNMANRVFGDIVAFKDAFRNYVTSASAGIFSRSTGALPLQYTLRRISDNSLLAVRSVGSYDNLIGCNTSTYKVEVLWKGFKVVKVIEGPLDTQEDIWGSLSISSATVNGTNRNIGKIIKSIGRNNAISVAQGSTDADDITVNVLNGLTQSEITATTLNFAQAIKDWEPFHTPEYKPAASAELKFNLADKRISIIALQPGSSTIFDNPINLVESGPTGESKITLLTKIRVTRF